MIKALHLDDRLIHGQVYIMDKVSGCKRTFSNQR